MSPRPIAAVPGWSPDREVAEDRESHADSKGVNQVLRDNMRGGRTKHKFARVDRLWRHQGPRSHTWDDCREPITDEDVMNDLEHDGADGGVDRGSTHPNLFAGRA